MKKTATFKVLEYLYENGYASGKPCHALALMKIIFSEETIKKWNHARRHKRIIETMTYSFVGKLARKDYIRSVSNLIDPSIKEGYRLTEKGIKYYKSLLIKK